MIAKSKKLIKKKASPSQKTMEAAHHVKVATGGNSLAEKAVPDMSRVQNTVSTRSNPLSQAANPDQSTFPADFFTAMDALDRDVAKRRTAAAKIIQKLARE